MTQTRDAPSGKALAANDKLTRDEAIQQLREYLAGNQQPSADLSDAELQTWDDESDFEVEERFSDAELLKLWKAIFYCFWMSDKPLVQQQLADTLADLVLIIRPSAQSSSQTRFITALAFIRAFWTTMQREWAGIDRLRIDKFLLLCRRYQEASLRLLQREGWRQQAVKKYNEMVLTAPLNTKDPKAPLALSLHFVELLLPSLAKLSNEGPLPLLSILEPVVAVWATCTAQKKNVASLIESEICRPILEACRSDSMPAKKRRKTDQPSPDVDQILSRSITDLAGKALESTQLASRLCDHIFSIASAEATLETNRRKMYALVREFQSDST